MTTILLNSATLLIPCFLCVFFSWLLYQSNRRMTGTKSWSLGTATFGCALLFYNWVHVVPVPFGVVIANHLFLAGLVLQLIGTQQFFNRPVAKQPIIIGVVLFSLSYCYFYYVEPNTNARIIIFSLSYIIITSSILQLVTRYRGEHFRIAVISLYVAIGLGLALMSYRIGITLFPDLFGGKTGLTLINQLISGPPFFICCGMLLGFFSLCSERQFLHIQHLNKQAQQQADNKQKLLAFLSHEFRTPLNAIVGKAQLLSRQLDSAAARYDCELIAEAGMALSAVNQNILYQAEAEHSGILIKTTETIELRDWLKRLTDTYRMMAEGKGLQLCLTVSTDVPVYVQCNKTILQQVLVNLISNAIKYSDAGQIMLNVAPGDTDQYKFSISDQGQGIPETEQQKVLLPFGRAWHSMQQEGSGLGLALTQQLLHSIGSSLAFNSTYGQGSRFYFSLFLPAVTTAPAANASTADLAESKTVKHVLIVEDVPLNQKVISGMIAHIKHVSTMAATLSHAEELLRCQLFDLILLDLNLPDGDGLAFFKRIKAQHPLMPDTHIVTANISIATRQQCLAEGIKTVLYKPILLEGLQELFMQKTEALPLLDKKQFWQLARYIPDETLQRQLQQLNSDIEEIINQLEIANLEHQSTLIHKLAGKAATLGLVKLAQTCHNLLSNPVNIATYLVFLRQLTAVSLAEIHKQITDNDT